MSAEPPEDTTAQPAGDSTARELELGRILHGLDLTKRAALARSEELAAAADLDVTLVPAMRGPSASGRLRAARAPTGRSQPSALGPSLLRSAARPVATVVITVTGVMLILLLVLEPLLGARPVLVRDDGMSPSLRVGDVAFAEEPTGPLASGAIVAVRVDGRVRVSRLIDSEVSEDVPREEARASARLVLRDDAQDLSERTVVDADALVGVVGAAVPRVGLPAVWLLAPAGSPLGALSVAAVIAVTAVGLRDARRERRVGGGRTGPSDPSAR